jgi:hypothetical protein
MLKALKQKDGFEKLHLLQYSLKNKWDAKKARHLS